MKPIEAAADRDLRGEVEHAIDAGERVGHRRLIAHVAVDEARFAGHDVAASHREVVEHRDPPPLGEERAREMGPDEARAPGHEGVRPRHHAGLSTVALRAKVGL